MGKYAHASSDDDQMQQWLHNEYDNLCERRVILIRRLREGDRAEFLIDNWPERRAALEAEYDAAEAAFYAEVEIWEAGADK